MSVVNTVSVHPNPATTKVNITASEAIRVIKILTITGQEVLNKTSDNKKSETIPVGALPSGLYNITVITANATCSTLLYKTD